MNEETKIENNLTPAAEIAKTEPVEKEETLDPAETEISDADFARNKKMDKYIEFALLFILGVLVGIAIKTEAARRITIGFDDHQMTILKQDFDFNALQLEVAKEVEQETESNQE